MKRTYKKLICVILSAVLLLSALPLTVHAAADTYNVSTPQELRDAVTDINGKGTGEYTISLTANITSDIGGIDIGSIKDDKTGTVVTIIGNGHYLSCPTGQNVQAWNGAKVILGDGKTELTLIGGVTNDNPGVVYVFGSDSVCTMNDKVTIKDNKSSNYLGGGVTVLGGTFHMLGGTIENCGINGGSVCYGGGVGVAFGAQFIMDGGTIKDCFVRSDLQDTYDENNQPLTLNREVTYVAGGGVFVYCGGSFVMNGGSIENCTATCSSEYPAVGGGVATITSLYSIKNHDNNYGYLDSCVKITKGTISGCTADFGGALGAGRIKAQLSPIATYTPDSTPNPNAPGIYISGGTMSGNTARTLGGGLDFYWIRKDINVSVSNLTLTNNKAPEGGAVCIDEKWTNATFANCTMTQNSATNGKGGAIFIKQNVKKQHTVTTIDSCTIKNNTATDKGAGVYYTVGEDTNDDSVLAVKGANIIQDNTVGNSLNNLYFQGYVHPVIVTGSLAGSQIGITDAKLWEDNLEDTDPAALSFEGLTKDYEVYNSKSTKSEYFTSDHNGWVVDDGGVVYPTTTYYQYEAKKYLTDPELTEGYPVQQRINEAGNPEYYIILDISPETGWTENAGTLNDPNSLISQLKRILDSEYVYDIDNSKPDKNQYWYYDPKSENRFLLWHYNQNNIYIYLYYGRSSNLIAILQGAGGVQDFAGVNKVDGKMALKLYWYDPDSDPYIPDYKSTPSSTETVEYDSPLTEDETTYLVNDIGLVSGKLVVDKSTEQEVEKPATPIDYSSEVRLVRKDTVDYHINNKTIADAKYQGEDIFTSYVAESTGGINIGDTINEFYTVPEVTPTKQNSCPYIFKGWYYDKANNNDTRPVNFGTDTYFAGRDIYAHWIEVNDVAKDAEDEYNLPDGETEYGGFDLTGVQVRNRIIDTNFDNELMPGGLRFMTSLSMDVVNQIKAIKDDNIEYGYVAATKEDWIVAHESHHDKLQYVSTTANGKNTSTYDEERPQDYFGFAKNVVCTSKKINTGDFVKEDHRNFKDYLLYTLVITYEDGKGMDKNVLARPYIRYKDANGLDRVAYSEYRGTNTLGGCYTSYNAILPTP